MDMRLVLTLVGYIARLEKENEELKRQLDGEWEPWGTEELEEEVDTLSCKVEGLEEELDKAFEEIFNLEEQISDLQDELEEYEDEIDELQGKLYEKDNFIKELMEEMKKYYDKELEKRMAYVNILIQLEREKHAIFGFR